MVFLRPHSGNRRGWHVSSRTLLRLRWRNLDRPLTAAALATAALATAAQSASLSTGHGPLPPATHASSTVATAATLAATQTTARRSLLTW